MVNYPLLSTQQQQHLPELIQAIRLPTMYEDSTHQIWQCDTVDGLMILKVCNTENVKKASFWQGMKHLFDVDLIQSLGKFDFVYQKISKYSSLVIPKFIASDSESSPSSPAFILAQYVSGTMVDMTEIKDGMIEALARHISQCHQKEQSQWGEFQHAKYSANEWGIRLYKTLEELASNHSIPETIRDEAYQQARTLSVESFVPVMMDLRWDQFLQQKQQLSALVDLDAFVYAPKELELVLLEYLLDEQQANKFKQHYQQEKTIDDLSQVRKAYRLLLFLMNILGEKDIERWMNAPVRF